jgi:hypothetical protein
MSAEPAYSATGTMIHKAPVHTKLAEGGTSISLGFPVCEVTEWVGEEQASTVADLLCRGEQVDALREALAACYWALQQAQEDLSAFEAGTRTKRSVSTSSAITAALSRIPDIQIKGAA